MIVDHRTYTLRPGSLPEYLAKYEEMGLKVQIKHLGRLAGYFFTEIGPLNQIVHIWAYESLAERDERRSLIITSSPATWSSASGTGSSRTR